MYKYINMDDKNESVSIRIFLKAENSKNPINQTARQSHKIKKTDSIHETRDTLLFKKFIRHQVQKHNMKWKDIFLEAGFSEHFGRNLISGEKHTRQRDYILRLCFAMHLSLEDTQYVLKLYSMGKLYVRCMRDALIMTALHDQIYSLEEVDELLTSHGFEALKKSKKI